MRLSNQSDFKVFMSWLSDSREALKEELVLVPVESVQILQGRILELSDVLDLTDNVKDVYDKMMSEGETVQ